LKITVIKFQKRRENMFRFEEERGYWANLKVVGVGGGGSNAVDRMIRAEIRGVEFIAINTDAQALKASLSTNKMQIGSKLTEGLGAGSDPDVGRKAVEEDIDLAKQAIDGSNMVFLTAGMGGGTGTGAIPVVAQLAREMEILTVAIVTLPFGFEGRKRRMQAEQGIAQLNGKVDTLIVIPNDNLMRLCNNATSLNEAFRMADDVLYHGVKGISDLITTPGLINLDFADVRTIMRDAGQTLMGMGSASGEGRAVAAVKMAISNPLVNESCIDSAKRILFNISGKDLKMGEVQEAATLIQKMASDDVHIIFGTVEDDSMGDEATVMIIASGFEKKIAQDTEQGAEVDTGAYAAAQDYDRPAYKRRSLIDKFGTRLDEEKRPHPVNNLEIPAFLRNKII